MFKLHLPERPFRAIKKGIKKIEGRSPHSKDNKYEKIKPGDTLIFENEETGEKLKTKILFVHHYRDVKAMLLTEGVENVLSSEPKTIEHGVESYNTISDYKERILKFGIYAIGVEPNIIKAILFDMVGVLVFNKAGYIAKTKEEINARNIEKLFNHIDDQKLISDISVTLSLSDLEIENACKLIPEKYEKFEDIWEFLPELKKKYKLAVINNGNSIALKYWKEKFDFSIFDLYINSAVEGVKKPDPKIYLLACEKLNVKPEECLFMDDSLENIESTKNLGMETIWWNKDVSREDHLQNLKSL